MEGSQGMEQVGSLAPFAFLVKAYQAPMPGGGSVEFKHICTVFTSSDSLCHLNRPCSGGQQAALVLQVVVLPVAF